MIRKHVRERQARRLEEGRIDREHRCEFCRRELPTIGTVTRFGRPGSYCAQNCVDDAVERDLMRSMARLR